MKPLREALRDRLNVIPVNIEGLIEDLGIDLIRKGELDPRISGQIERIDGDKYRITANKAESYFRRRFTMAHELAHYLLHKDLIGAGVDDTRAYRSTDIGRFHNVSILPEHETEANRLAARLLMPGEQVRGVHAECAGDLLEIAKRFQVSAESMGYRLQALGLPIAGSDANA
jgi:Zn-dependent peptidase ImmA (M78 family)